MEYRIGVIIPKLMAYLSVALMLALCLQTVFCLALYFCLKLDVMHWEIRSDVDRALV